MYDCDPGYTVIGNSVRTCQADGAWSGEEPVCESKLAQIRIVSSLPLEDWYQNQDQGFKFCIYLNDGYLFIALLVINCTMLVPPSNGRLDINPSTTAPGRFTATYFCDDGYELVGDNDRVCLADGSWTGSDPDCARKLNARAVSTQLCEGWGMFQSWCEYGYCSKMYAAIKVFLL